VGPNFIGAGLKNGKPIVEIFLARFYDQQDVTAIAGKPKARESTFGISGRLPIEPTGSVRLIAMTAARTRGPPLSMRVGGFTAFQEKVDSSLSVVESRCSMPISSSALFS